VALGDNGKVLLKKKLAHDQRSACWFHKSLTSSQIEYENHRGRTHKRYAVVRSVPSL
jgi:hypothetical protein